MDGHHGPGLDGVEHTLRMIFRGIAEIEIHPQARRSLGFIRQLIQQGVIYNLHLFGHCLSK